MEPRLIDGLGVGVGVGFGDGAGLGRGLLDVPPDGVGLLPGVALGLGLDPGVDPGLITGVGDADAPGSTTWSVTDFRHCAAQQSLTV